MFTGLVQAVGKVHLRGKGVLVEGCQPFSPLSLGDSIAVDGVCLTVSDLIPNGFIADVSEETISRTTLGKKAALGEFVNLEPALRLSDRIGGHLVSGHVDGLGKIVSIENLNNSWNIKIQWQAKNFDQFICEKASVALNGISLTVAFMNNEESSFSIAVIPHTWKSTSLQYLVAGELVNLEADLMAKYAKRLLESKSSKNKNKNNKSKQPSDITKEWLGIQGW